MRAPNGDVVAANDAHNTMSGAVVVTGDASVAAPLMQALSLARANPPNVLLRSPPDERRGAAAVLHSVCRRGSRCNLEVMGAALRRVVHRGEFDARVARLRRAVALTWRSDSPSGKIRLPFDACGHDRIHLP